MEKKIKFYENLFFTKNRFLSSEFAINEEENAEIKRQMGIITLLLEELKRDGSINTIRVYEKDLILSRIFPSEMLERINVLLIRLNEIPEEKYKQEFYLKSNVEDAIKQVELIRSVAEEKLLNNDDKRFLANLTLTDLKPVIDYINACGVEIPQLNFKNYAI
jgi:hypothetical protein